MNSKSKWTIKFVEAYKHDEIATRNLKISNKKYNKNENELLLFEELLYVSKNFRKEIIQNHHDESLQNHTNATKILEKIQRNYYFSNMRKQIKELIKECDLCQRNKYERHKSYEYLHSLESFKKSRQFISMNFITKLSLSIHSIIEVIYDFILVIVNKLTKSTKFTSFQKSTNTKAFIKIFTKVVIANKEISKEVISNKNKLFTSKYWNAVTNKTRKTDNLYDIDWWC